MAELTQKMINSLIKTASKKMGMYDIISFEIDDIGYGYANGSLEVKKTHLNHTKSVHGGILYTLCDTIAGAAAATDGRTCVTVNSTIDFVKPANDSKIICKSEVIRFGSRFIRTKVEIFDTADNLLCYGSFLYAPIEFDISKMIDSNK